MNFIEHTPILSNTEFKWLVEKAPLFALDFVVVNSKDKVLVGKRKNEPACNFWFVPGGRVRKNETIKKATSRILDDELNFDLEGFECQFLGVFEHFYDNSFFGDGINTHYVTATYLVQVDSIELNILPKCQHDKYRWVSLDELERDDSVHFYSKVFIPILQSRLKCND